MKKLKRDDSRISAKESPKINFFEKMESNQIFGTRPVRMKRVQGTALYSDDDGGVSNGSSS